MTSYVLILALPFAILFWIAAFYYVPWVAYIALLYFIARELDNRGIFGEPK